MVLPGVAEESWVPLMQSKLSTVRQSKQRREEVILVATPMAGVPLRLLAYTHSLACARANARMSVGRASTPMRQAGFSHAESRRGGLSRNWALECRGGKQTKTAMRCVDSVSQKRHLADKRRSSGREQVA